MQFLSKVVVGRPAGLAMSMVGVLMMVGCGSSITPNTATVTPALSLPAGAYNAPQKVTITDATPGAVLYCTTDGTVPTTSSPVCAAPTTIFQTEFLQVIAVAPGSTASAIAAAAYTIDLAAAATPTFSPAGGTYATAQMVTIGDTTTGANIYYTTDGTVPTASSTLYAGPITVSATETISAIAVASGFGNSGIASANYTIGQGIAAPAFSVASGNYTFAQAVTISDTTSGAAIYYTVDGSAPTASSTPYTGPITVSRTEIVNAIAIASGRSSTVAIAAYTISLPGTGTGTGAPSSPTISPAPGTYTTAQTVTITDATPGAAIYYTIDGSTPTTSSTMYSRSINVSTDETVKAIAVVSGVSSPVATATYTIDLTTTATPTLSPADGAFTTSLTVTISDAAAGASIYYTVDGSTPTTSSTQYSGPITVSATETIKAIAASSGLSNSAVATATYTISAGALSLSGTVLSGSVPVNGAQVQLYSAGQTGYGSAATPLLGNVSTNSSGAFSFTYNCPGAPGDLVYLVATGGNTGDGPNSSLELTAALGSCTTMTAPAQIVVNEITTVASAYALSPFMITAPDVGTSTGYPTTGNYQGLANAFKTVSNMVNLATGQAYSITPAYAMNPVPFLNTSTVPQSRINTLANLLNACVNSSGTGGGCSNLFSNATPTGGTIPSNTLQAILSIAQNPGNNAAALFPLASPTGPFQPVLSAAPGDWTLALTFTGAGLGIQPSVQGTITGPDGAKGGSIVNIAMAIDATGNIWVTAYGNQLGGVFDNSGMIAKFSNQGVPLTPATTMDTNQTTVLAWGGFNPEPVPSSSELTALAIDQAGNLWIGDNGANLTQVSSGLSVVQPPVHLGSIPATSIAVDAFGNIWVANDSLDEFQVNPLLPAFKSTSGASPADVNGYNRLNYLTFDTNGGLWGTDNNGQGDLYSIDTSDGSIAADLFHSSGAYTSLIADGSGNVYGCSSISKGAKPGLENGQSLNVFNAGALVSTFPIASGRGCGNQMVLDGQGHIFAVAGVTAPGIVDEFTTAGVLISPAAGYTGTSSGEAPAINPDSSLEGINAHLSVLTSVAGAAIDGSGNLWVLNADTGFAGTPAIPANPVTKAPAVPAVPPGPPGNVLVQYVGIAAPVITPISVALQNSQLGARP